jgi:tRNA uridine 5-carboxymethylaminomethyl modification enzyme
MMTSRSEYRLVLRQDNADERLMPIGYKLGLISQQVYDEFTLRTQQKADEIERLNATFIGPQEALNKLLEERGTAPMTTGMRLADLVKRPQLSYKDLAPFDKERPVLSDAVSEKVETEIKYEGYISRQQAQINEMLRLENKLIPADINYEAITGLRLEAIEKLNKIRPVNIGQASRISGVSPADVTVLLIYLSK